MIPCAWCESLNVDGATHCASCGGPLPAPPGSDPGPAPPPPPRALPKGFIRRRLKTQVQGLVGCIFALVGGPFLVIFPIIGISTGQLLFLVVGGLIGGAFFFGGVALVVWSWKTVQAGAETFRLGRAVQGTIDEVYQDGSIQVNGRSPWLIAYSFEVAGTPHSGSVHAWHPSAQDRARGQLVHVVYMPEDPARSTVYPPIA